MDNNELREKWPTIKPKLMAQYPQLTVEELQDKIVADGKLLEYLQEKLGKNKDEIHDFLSVMG